MSSALSNAATGVLGALRPSAAASFQRLFSAAADASKGASSSQQGYVYQSPGSSIKEPSYGVSISDPDVHYYDAKPGLYSTTVAVSNPNRQPACGAGPGQNRVTYTFASKPSPKDSKYILSLSDPVFKTENDTKN